LLNFLKARDEAAFKNIQFKNNQLTFIIHSSYQTDSKITAMVPLLFKGKKIQVIEVNGAAVKFLSRYVKGTSYAFVPVAAGLSHQIIVTYK
jgi:hypothetical protein